MSSKGSCTKIRVIKNFFDIKTCNLLVRYNKCVLLFRRGEFFFLYKRFVSLPLSLSFVGDKIRLSPADIIPGAT